MSSRSQIWGGRDVLPFAVEPLVAFFPSNGGKSEHTTINMGDKRIAVKILCSNNQTYRVIPVCYFIEPAQTQTITVTRLQGPPRTDKLVFQFMEAAATDNDVKQLFKGVEKSKIDTIKVQLKMEEKKEGSRMTDVVPK